MINREAATTAKGSTGIRNQLRTDEDRDREASKVKLTPEQELRAAELYKKGVSKTLEDAIRLEKLIIVWQRQGAHIVEATRDSQILTAEDFAIIVR